MGYCADGSGSATLKRDADIAELKDKLDALDVWLMPEGVKKERTGLADARKKVVSAAQAAVKRGVDRTKIYELIAEKNNGHDSPTEIPTIALCEEIAAAIKNMKK